MLHLQPESQHGGVGTRQRLKELQLCCCQNLATCLPVQTDTESKLTGAALQGPVQPLCPAQQGKSSRMCCCRDLTSPAEAGERTMPATLTS